MFECPHRRLFWRTPALEPLAIPGDYEERVVDAHAQADDHGHGRSDRVDGHAVREKADAEEASEPSATPAVTSGSSMPNSEPKASRMITPAATTPMAMLLGSDVVVGRRVATQLDLQALACAPRPAARPGDGCRRGCRARPERSTSLWRRPSCRLR